MSLHKFSSASLIVMLAVGISPVAAQQQAATVGIIAGRADEARRPYSNYVVQLRDIEAGQVVSSIPLDAQGNYRLTDVPLSRSFLVELYHVSNRQVVCTEGPQTLTPAMSLRENLDIDCGITPAAWWLLGAAAGAAAAAAVVTQSASE